MSIKKYGRLNHSLWEDKYYIVLIPKYRKKSCFGVLKEQLGSVFRKLAE